MRTKAFSFPASGQADPMMDTMAPGNTPVLSMSSPNGSNNMACIYSHSSRGKSADVMTMSDNDSETPISSPDEPNNSYKMTSSNHVHHPGSPSQFKSEMMDAPNNTY